MNEKTHHMMDPSFDEDPLTNPPNQEPNLDVRYDPLTGSRPDDAVADKKRRGKQPNSSERIVH